MSKYSKKSNIAILLPNTLGGGAERVASELSRFFEEEGHNVYIFTESAGKGYIFGGRIVLLRPSVANTLLPKEIGELYELSKEIKKQKKKVLMIFRIVNILFPKVLKKKFLIQQVI